MLKSLDPSGPRNRGLSHRSNGRRGPRTNLKAVLCGALLIFASAHAEMHRIDSPGGGTIKVGTLDGQPTPQQAMGTMLQRIGQSLGNRPQLGRGMRDASGHTLAVFFNVQTKNSPGKTVSGLLIVAAAPGQETSVAVMTDEASRFATTLPAMLQQVHAQAASTAGNAGVANASAAPSGQAAPLQAFRFPDGSGVMGLPAGWKVLEVSKGAIHATGPDRSWLIFGASLPVVDPRVPGSRAFSAGASIVPFSTQPIPTYTSVVTQVEQKQHKQPPTIHITKVQPGPDNQEGTSWILFGDYDQHDGHGPMTLRAQVRWGRPSPQGVYMFTLYEIAGPPASAAAQDATVMAIFKSYNPNSQTITNQYLAEGQRSQQIAHAFVAQEQQRQDASQRNTQAISNILLDKSVVRDTEYNAHGTFDNDLSSALVKSNPDRFQVVPQSEFVKGIDY